ncbi:ribose-phosphate pyrophosphokinase [Alphaproteobacteria bacterium]|nr:ribose-phosphate pyrophosphokinase [Alphaproteobacteria bacterium]
MVQPLVYCRSSQDLAKSVAQELAIPAFHSNVKCFNNKELVVSLGKSFREVVVIASTTNHDEWMELFLLLDALRSAKNVVLCLTYMGYSRQDQQEENESFGAGLFSRLLDTMNISSCIILDNHCEPLLRTPTRHISARRIFEADISKKYKPDYVAVVSPDIGGAYRADLSAKSLGCDFAICNKAKNVFGKLKSMYKLGDVSDKICVLIDDMVDSGSTLCYASDVLMSAGAKDVVAYCTHGVLSDGSIKKLEKSALTEIVLTDSIAHPQPLPEKFRKLSIASLIAEAIRCIL